jgi:hypothetical protein
VLVRFRPGAPSRLFKPVPRRPDGTFSLADARRERDEAKDLLKEGKDPSTDALRRRWRHDLRE